MDFQLPELGEGVYEAELVEWLVTPGATVKQGQPLAEVMTDKATMELPAPFAGRITDLLVNEGDDIQVGGVILKYEGAKGTKRKTAKKKKKKAAAKASSVSRDVAQTVDVAQSVNGDQTAASVRAAPSVRRMARQLGIDLHRVPGSGPSGRILIDDLAACIQASSPPPATTSGSESRQPTDLLGLTNYRAGTRIKLKGIRRKIAEQMVHAKTTIPHYSYVDECDVTELVNLRGSLKETCQRQGVKLTYMAFFVKAVVEALKEVAIANASLDEETSEIVLHDRYDIGIATNTRDGLVVPVIRNADTLDILQVAREIDRLSNAARDGKAARDELRNGTFTITSIGGIGGLISTPIINHPEVGIMGVGQVVKRPVYDDAGNIRPADMLYLSFSFDHRVVDGAIGATFGNIVSQHLKNPAAMLLPVS